MENKIYPDNFESFLRESTEDFRMYPSKKVWNSLYNSMHPAKKWPSLAVLLLLISSMLFIGISNPSKITKSSVNQTSTTEPLLADVSINNLYPETEKVINSSDIAQVEIKNTTSGNHNLKTEVINKSQPVNLTSIKDNNLFSFNPEKGLTSNLSLFLKNHNSSEYLNADVIEEGKTQDDLNSEKNDKKINELIDHINDNQKNKLAFEFYATPSIGYRVYTNNNDAITSMARYSFGGNSSSDNPINHSSSLNLEAGGNVLFSLSSNLRIKAGVQLNYTNYNINAYELNNPTFTTLLMNDLVKNQPVLSTRNSNLSNIPQSGNQVNLNNNTYQLSLPLGADFKLAGNSLIQWYAGATVQPTYVAGGNAYLISSENNSYVSEGSAIRKFNINGGFETFVSYKLKEGFILNAGPQFRYQFLSTYSNEYMLNEKLYNLGVKLGVTTNF